MVRPGPGPGPPRPPSSERCPGRGREGLVTAQFTALYSLAAIGSFAVLSNQHTLASTVYRALGVAQPLLVPHLFCTGPRHINIFSIFSPPRLFLIRISVTLSLLPLCYFEPPKVRPCFSFVRCHLLT